MALLGRKLRYLKGHRFLAGGSIALAFHHRRAVYPTLSVATQSGLRLM